MEKSVWKSRKLWAAIAAVVTVLVGEIAGDEAKDAVQGILTIILGYFAAHTATDVAAMFKKS